MPQKATGDPPPIPATVLPSSFCLCLPQLPRGTVPVPPPPLLCDGPFVLVDVRHLHAGEDVGVHVVGACYVVNVRSVGVQVDGVTGEEVSVDDREEAQVVYQGVWGGAGESSRFSHLPVPTCPAPQPPGQELTPS